MNRACLFQRASRLAVRLSSTAASNRTLEGKVAVVTASTEGYVARVPAGKNSSGRGIQYSASKTFCPGNLVVISE